VRCAGSFLNGWKAKKVEGKREECQHGPTSTQGGGMDTIRLRNKVSTYVWIGMRDEFVGRERERAMSKGKQRVSRRGNGRFLCPR
jgi:hypothetical protein